MNLTQFYKLDQWILVLTSLKSFAERWSHFSSIQIFPLTSCYCTSIDPVCLDHWICHRQGIRGIAAPRHNFLLCAEPQARTGPQITTQHLLIHPQRTCSLKLLTPDIQLQAVAYKGNVLFVLIHVTVNSPCSATSISKHELFLSRFLIPCRLFFDNKWCFWGCWSWCAWHCGAESPVYPHSSTTAIPFFFR